jgi:DNA-binding CsgD family transcriptional regulator
MLRHCSHKAILAAALSFPAMLGASPLKLSADWQYRPERIDEVVSQACTQNAGWIQFRFPGQPPGRFAGRILWERTLLQPMAGQTTLKFMTVDQFVEVYLGAKLIYAVGNPGAPARSLTLGNTPHLIELPQLHAPTPLCFRIFSRTANAGINGDIWLGTEKDILGMMVRQDLPRLVLICLYFLCALGLIAFRFVRASDRAFLTWGLYILCFSLWLLTQTEIKQLLYSDALLWRIVDYAALFQLPIWIALFLEQIFGPGAFMILRRIWQLHAALAVALAALTITGYVLAETALLIIQVGIALQLLIFLLVLCLRTLQGDHEARIFFGSAILFGLTGLHDILSGLTILPWSLPISIWGTLFVLIAAIVILLRRFAVARHREAALPEIKAASTPLFVILQTKFGLTYQEAQICAEIDEGSSRGEIARKLAIRASTLKIHLRSIYAKTIERNGRPLRASRDKLQRLTIFLKRLQERA